MPMTSIPSANFTPRISFGNWLCPSMRRQVFWAPSMVRTGLTAGGSRIRNHRSPVRRGRRFEPASVPSRSGRCRRGVYGPGGDRRPDRAVEIADCRWCASEPPLESRIKPSRRVGPSRGTDGSNPLPSSSEFLCVPSLARTRSLLEPRFFWASGPKFPEPRPPSDRSYSSLQRRAVIYIRK